LFPAKPIFIYTVIDGFSGTPTGLGGNTRSRSSHSETSWPLLCSGEGRCEGGCEGGVDEAGVGEMEWGAEEWGE
jgi:hypothetical protein